MPNFSRFPVCIMINRSNIKNDSKSPINQYIFNRKATFCELNDPQMNIKQNLELRSIS